MKFWFQRSIKCSLCKSKMRKKDSWDLVVNTSEGPHKICVCADCMKTFEQLKEVIPEWLKD
jgi:hypothetical protein